MKKPKGIDIKLWGLKPFLSLIPRKISFSSRVEESLFRRRLSVLVLGVDMAVVMECFNIDVLIIIKSSQTKYNTLFFDDVLNFYTLSPSWGFGVLGAEDVTTG